ncbi:alpha-crystallin B chain-like [Brevipalpus obovatus]|uniref:alpha-crystallin B chain-like n=1 Tax=Brevipalpus obovatus TaxID=246614 RepID=UPI003D9E587A
MSSEREKKLHVHRDSTNLIDSEYNSIKDRFDQEMRKMEEEMNRFRNRLQDRERDFFSSSRSLTSSSKTQTSHQTSSHSENKSEDMSNWLDDLKSPLVRDTDDGKVLKLRFDVTQYQPEEIVVKTIDNRLQVHAKHEEKSENRSVYREYNREFLLPSGVNPESIRSSLSKDGVLTVEAPLPAIEAEKRIPISHQ